MSSNRDLDELDELDELDRLERGQNTKPQDMPTTQPPENLYKYDNPKKTARKLQSKMIPIVEQRAKNEHERENGLLGRPSKPLPSSVKWDTTWSVKQKKYSPLKPPSSEGDEGSPPEFGGKSRKHKKYTKRKTKKGKSKKVKKHTKRKTKKSKKN